MLTFFRYKLLPYIVSLMVLLSGLGKTFILVSFTLNKKFISEQLCENRYRPEMLCSGKCVLVKSINSYEESNDKNNSSQSKYNSLNIDLFYIENLILPQAEVIKTVRKSSFSFIHRWYSCFINDFFQPPQAF